MSRRVLFVWMLVSALAVVVPKAWAQRPPQTDPPRGVFTQDVVQNWDRSAIPAEIELWAPRTLLAYDTDLTQRYGELYMVCASSSDASTGRCPTEDMLVLLSSQATQVSVRLQEIRSGLTSNLDVSASLFRAFSTADCSLDYWNNQPYGIPSSIAPSCDKKIAAGTGKGLTIRSPSLRSLTAGHWKGTLELRLRRPPSEHLATYIFNFDFTITDYDAISIYLPGFEQGNANVNMDLRYDPRIIGGSIAGSKGVDMCLYDGLGSQSEYLGITVRDTGSRPSVGDDFSLWHRDAAGDDRERISFNVWLNYAGSKRRMRNGVEEQLLGVDKTELRLVKLPKLEQPVYCVPTPITLETPSFTASSKREGVYTGELKVELRVPTVRP
ncbi:CfaE/CblD family pilus tip adhesin [Stenotrophomonas sp.]|uniref:CfaE/CblD family pilus tip adhesin n=1 Tax=Stenotrophomonas sp. TaxID=69392 RepID=UPI0028A953C8|nr:CfaE/CblD family pilus tip adhesin [Stenotrophomonas sp.]